MVGFPLKISIIVYLIVPFIYSCNSTKKLKTEGDLHYENQDYLFAQRKYEAFLERDSSDLVEKRLIDCYKAQGKHTELLELYRIQSESGNSIDTLDYIHTLLHEKKYAELNAYIATIPSNSTSLIEDIHTYDSFTKILSKNSDYAIKKNSYGDYCVELKVREDDYGYENLKFNWKFDNNINATGHSVKQCFKQGGKHQAILSAHNLETGNFIPNIDTIRFEFPARPEIRINNSPIIEYVSAQTINNYSLVEDHDYAFVWDFGNGDFGVGQSTNYQYDYANSTTIKVYALDIASEKIAYCIHMPVSVLFDLRQKK